MMKQHTRTSLLSWSAVITLGVIVALLVLAPESYMATLSTADKIAATHPSLAKIDKIIGPNRCGECHAPELSSWQASAHYTSYKEMHRKPEAKAIAKRMGIRRIKRAPECIQCHYTPKMKKEKLSASSGVSCESCHGAAEEWVKIHDDFGGKDVNRASEAAAHRDKRLGQCFDLGMTGPAHLFDLARQCFECHTMLDPAVVNVGQHSMKNDFELLAWSQGEVRHNFIASKGKANSIPPVERQRQFYFVGQLLNLEYAVLALSRSGSEGAHFDASKVAVENSIQSLQNIASKNPNLGIADLLVLTKDVAANYGDSSALLQIAQSLQKKSKQLSQEKNDLSSLDSLLPKASDYKGKALEAAPLDGK